MTRPYDNIEFIDTQIVAAKQSVNRSKRFDRSAKEHLEQHQRWLEQYVAQEARDRERHARRLRHLQLRHQRRVRRERVIQWCKQLALAVALFVRSSGLSMLKGVVSALIYLAELLSISASWLGANVYALARLLIKLLAVSFSWVQGKSHDLARSTAKLLSIGLSWSRVKARAFALSLVNAASASFAWVQGKSHDLARSTAKLLSIGLSWSRVKAQALALSLVDAASASFAWVQGKSHDLARSTAKLLSIGLSWSRVKAQRPRAFPCRCRVGQLRLGPREVPRPCPLDCQAAFNRPVLEPREGSAPSRFPLSMPRRPASPGSKGSPTTLPARLPNCFQSACLGAA